MVSEKLGAAFVEVGADLSPLEKSLGSIPGMMQHAGTNITGGLKSSLQGGNFTDVGKQLGNQLVTGMTSQFGMLGQAAGTFATALGPAGIALLGIGASIAAIGVGLGKCVSSAATWQDLMVDVQKVTTTTEAGFSKLSSDLLAIRGSTGASMEDIAGAAAGAGRMGIAPEEIADYTETILKMSSAWGMSADAASDSIGKIGSVVKPAEMSWTEFGNRMGSTINDLADSMATSEESIVTGMKKVSAQMAMLKPDPSQLSAWAALVGQLQAFGMTAETSGESLKDSLNYMMRDDKGGISSMLDMDTTEFQEAIREDAIGTIQELAVAISELPIDEQGQALQKFGATGGQMMGMLVGKVDPVTKEIEGLNAALATGAGAWENASSLNEAYAKSQETLNAQIEIFKGKISVAATSIGTVLLPFLTDMMGDINGITQALMDLGAKGWKWLYGGVDDEGAETKGAIGRLTGWLDEKLGIEYGAKLGEEMAGEIEPAVTGAVEDGLEEADGTAAGRKVGQEFTDEFKKSLDSMHAAGMRAVYEGGQIVGYESRSTDHKYQYGETFEAGGSTVGLRYEKGGQIPWLLTIGDWVGAFDSPEQAREYISRHFLALDSLISPEQWEIAMKTARQKTTGTYDDPGDVVRLKAELELAEISPYEVWGSPQHIAAKYAEYAREGIEEPLFNSIYNITRNLEEEGKAGMMQAWETILDPNATESQISAALSHLESSGVFGGWGRDVALQVRDGFAGLVDSIVDEGKYQEYKLEELGESWGAALKDSIIKVQEQETLLGIVAELEKAGYAGSEALKNAILAEDWEEVGRIVGEITGDGVVEGFGGIGERLSEEFMRASSALKSNEIFKMLWYGSPEDQAQAETWIRENVADQDVWFRKHLGDAASGWMKDAEEYGLRVDSSFWTTLETAWETHSEWFDDESRMFLEGVERRFGSIGGMINAPFETQIKLLDVLANGYKKVDDALTKYTAEADCACEAMSSFGMAQEKMSDQLFNRSYIGPTSGYAAFLEEERARGAFHPEAQQLSIVYKVEADTEAAEKSVEDLKNDIDQSEAAPRIDAMTQPAYDAVDSFLGWVSGISASVYVGAYGPGTEYMGGGDTGYLESLSPGITSSPGWGTSSWLPVLDSGGIVTGPTIASLAQDNRPEAIIPLDQITKIIGGGGPTYNISVNGGGNAEEIARAIRGAIEDYDREKNRSGAYA